MSAVPPARVTIPAQLLTQRDLASAELWERSLERSRRRRAAAEARRPGLQHASARKVSAALVTATLLAPGAQLASAAKSKRASAAQTSSTLLRSGSTGEAVTAAQRALGIATSGTFDAATEAAVKAFQRERGLEVDGIIGPQTAGALGLDIAARPGATPRTASPQTLRLDRATTKALQRAVGVRADGAIGPRTRAAIKRAERRNGLPVDGRPDADLLAKLGVADQPDSRATPRSAPAPAPADGQGAGAAVSAAQSAIGTPYGSGGNGPDAYDCSGLTVMAFKAAGITLPRTSYDQYAQGTRVAKSEIQAGDLVFFDTNGPGASHVGVATSPTSVISATTRGVMEHSFSSGYWAEHFVGARRLG